LRIASSGGEHLLCERRTEPQPEEGPRCLLRTVQPRFLTPTMTFNEALIRFLEK
jgi:hypothetical protein